ncbi:hypothetical protein K458DRAFT_286823 [Lentithecium fluviatile CBS 122367]|uniref:Xylanolytic transcriptional activator regulatory domain-containing protein n=1 Tax=Lentithecium fluviatile CBS 122367 TaxID=1168545 RepID=A0A6G1JNN1_9PLEO|nr:hypothetical protein K458DRAFT_286823 [Lentithecium fluviatile CBS 122367]
MQSPHRRKRKHDRPQSPLLTKRLDSRPAAPSTTSERSQSLVAITPEIAPRQNDTSRTDDDVRPGSYLGRAEYVSGTVPIDEEDATRYSSGRSSGLADEDKRYLSDLRVFELPPRSLYDSLIASFMQHCYPWMPIVESSELRATETFQPSLLLLHSVFVAASRVSLAPNAVASGDVFYRKAKALYHLGHEAAPMNVVRSICLLLWFNNSGPEHISLDASSFWLHMGVALAHQLGLHREPSPKQTDAKLRRRLWWTLFIRDCQIATSHGRPRTINPEDSNVRPLKLDDFSVPNDDASLFLAFSEICSTLTDLTESLVRGTLGWTKQISIETRLHSFIRDLPDSLRICDKQTGHVLPYNFKSRQLNVMFFTAIMLLHRPTTPGAIPSAAALLASSFSAGIFEDFLARGELGFLAPVFNFHLMTAAYAQLACFKYPLLWLKAECELEIVNKCLVEMAKRYPTAVGAQRVIRAVFRTVSAQKRHEGLIHITTDLEQMKYFELLGPDLCSKWSLVRPSAQNTIPGAQLPLQRRTAIGHLTVDTSLESPNPFPRDNLHMQLGAQPTPSDELSFGDSLLADIGVHDSYFATNGAFTAVGNWMLGDCTADVDWMNGGLEA